MYFNPKQNRNPLIVLYNNWRYAKRIPMNYFLIIFILFIEIGLLFTYRWHFIQLKNKEIQQHGLITTNIASSIILIEKEMHNALQNAALGLSAIVENKPNLSFKELQYYRDKFKVDNVDIWDADGRMELDADGTHLPNDPTYKMYNRNVFSIFDRCSEYKNLKSLPNEPIVSLFNRSAKRDNVVQKFSIVYNGKVKKFIDVAYNTESNRQSITTLFEKYLELHPNLLYIALSSPVRNIFSIAKDVSALNEEFLLHTDYIKEIHSEYHNGYFINKISFGGIHPNSCILRTENDVNKNEEFFYTIITNFDDKGFKNDVFRLKLLYLFIGIMMPFCVFYIKDKTESGYFKFIK